MDLDDIEVSITGHIPGGLICVEVFETTFGSISNDFYHTKSLGGSSVAYLFRGKAPEFGSGEDAAGQFVERVVAAFDKLAMGLQNIDRQHICALKDSGGILWMNFIVSPRMGSLLLEVPICLVAACSLLPCGIRIMYNT